MTHSPSWEAHRCLAPSQCQGGKLPNCFTCRLPKSRNRAVTASKPGDQKPLAHATSVRHICCMKVAGLIIQFASVFATAGFAAERTMICENSRREYVVKFDKSWPSLIADTTQYQVLAVENTIERLVIVGLTVEDGPTFRAHFRPYMKMEFFIESQLIQTDGCR